MITYKTKAITSTAIKQSIIFSTIFSLAHLFLTSPPSCLFLAGLITGLITNYSSQYPKGLSLQQIIINITLPAFIAAGIYHLIMQKLLLPLLNFSWL